MLRTDEAELIRRLKQFTLEEGVPQLRARERTLDVLGRQMRGCLPEAGRFGIILEYELARSGGRRPDVIVPENGT